MNLKSLIFALVITSITTQAFSGVGNFDWHFDVYDAALDDGQGGRKMEGFLCSIPARIHELNRFPIANFDMQGDERPKFTENQLAEIIKQNKMPGFRAETLTYTKDAKSRGGGQEIGYVNTKPHFRSSTDTVDFYYLTYAKGYTVKSDSADCSTKYLEMDLRALNSDYNFKDYNGRIVSRENKELHAHDLKSQTQKLCDLFHRVGPGQSRVVLQDKSMKRKIYQKGDYIFNMTARCYLNE